MKPLEISFDTKFFARIRWGIYSILLLQIGLVFPVMEQVFVDQQNFPDVFPWLHSHFLSLSHEQLAMTLIFFLILGLCSSHIIVKSIICILVLNFHLRMSSITDAGDAILDIWCFFLIFMSEKQNHNSSWQPFKNIASNILITVIRYQIAFIYLMAGVGKLFSQPWIEGNALIYIFQNPVYSHPFGMSLLQWPFILVIGSYFTILFQLAFPFFIWNQKARPYLLTIGTLIHLQISWLMGLFTFGIVMIVSYFIFHKRDFYAKT